ncbi:single-stranded DNA-binding protein [bacterium]|nr:MAG: single-stranded DNA-binding protein [bacterium]
MADLRLPSINLVLISGRLVSDPTLNYTTAGRPVLRFRIASNRNYKNQEGEWVQETIYINVVAWGKLAENFGEVLKKGSAVYIEGRLRTREWDDPSGQRRWITEIVAQRLQNLSKPEEVVEEEIPSEEDVVIEEPLPQEEEDELPF